MKLRIYIVCSVLWFLVVLVAVPTSRYDRPDWHDVVGFGIIPLVIAWGIWWIKKAKGKNIPNNDIDAVLRETYKKAETEEAKEKSKRC